MDKPEIDRSPVPHPGKQISIASAPEIHYEEWKGTTIPEDQALVIDFGGLTLAMQVLLSTELNSILGQLKTKTRVLIFCDKNFTSIISRTFPIGGNVLDIAAIECGPAMPFILHSLALSQVYIVRMKKHSLGPLQRLEGGHLKIDRDVAKQWEENYKVLSNEQITVGISWIGSSPEHSIRLHELAPMFKIPGVTWVNIQPGDVNFSDLNVFNDCGIEPIRDTRIDFDGNLEQIATFMAGLDLVIAADDFIGHLAASVGVNTWVVIPGNFDPTPQWALLSYRLGVFPSSPIYESMVLWERRNIKEMVEHFEQIKKGWDDAKLMENDVDESLI